MKEVVAYVRRLVGEKIGGKAISTKDIGIVTPFTLQNKHLQNSLRQENLGDVRVGTVEVFQGQEKEVIIVSAVRSKTFVHDDRQHIGFLSNPKRFNVALTRAKAILVVIGNPTALQTDRNWRYFMQFCRDHGACRGSEFELKEEDSDAKDDNRTQRVVKSTDLFTESCTILQIGE